jgi:hypothetical protein
MTLDEARRELECRFAVHPEIGNNALSATGEEFIVILSGGMKEEGDPLPIICSSPEIAIRMWLDAVLKYAESKHGTLYWRIPPELESVTYVSENYSQLPEDTRDAWAKHTYWVVYSRFLISDKPQVRPAIVERTAA